MQSLRISLQSWAPHAKFIAREALGFAAIGVLLFVAVLFEPYSNEQPYSHEANARVTRDHLSLPERLGYAILIHGGYARAELVVAEPAEGETEKSRRKQPIEAQLSLQPGVSEELECIRRLEPIAFESLGSVAMFEFVTAIIAAEKYNRSSFERSLEGWVARHSLSIRGRLPDFSYGLAQIRPGIARKALEGEIGGLPLSGADLLELMMNDCQNVRMAASHVIDLFHEHASAAVSIRALLTQVALAYNGASGRTVSGRRYVDAVLGAYELLAPSADTGDESPRQAPRQACVTFEVGSSQPLQSADELSRDLKLIADSGDEGLEKARKVGAVNESSNADSEDGEPEEADASNESLKAVRSVTIAIWNRDPGPTAYVQRLSARRSAVLIDLLLTLGLRREELLIVPSPGEPPRTCDAPAWQAIARVVAN